MNESELRFWRVGPDPDRTGQALRQDDAPCLNNAARFNDAGEGHSRFRGNQHGVGQVGTGLGQGGPGCRQIGLGLGDLLIARPGIEQVQCGLGRVAEGCARLQGGTGVVEILLGNDAGGDEPLLPVENDLGVFLFCLGRSQILAGLLDFLWAVAVFEFHHPGRQTFHLRLGLGHGVAVGLVVQPSHDLARADLVSSSFNTSRTRPATLNPSRTSRMSTLP